MISKFKYRLLLAVAPYTPWRWYLMSVSVLMLLVAIWWQVSYRSLRQQLNTLRDTVCEYTKPAIVQSMSPAHGDRFKSETVCTPQEDFFCCTTVRQFVAHITGSLTSGIKLKTYVVKNQERLPWALRMNITLGLEGDFLQMVLFFERYKPFTNLIIDQLEFEMVDDATVRSSAKLVLYLPCGGAFSKNAQ